MDHVLDIMNEPIFGEEENINQPTSGSKDNKKEQLCTVKVSEEKDAIATSDETVEDIVRVIF